MSDETIKIEDLEFALHVGSPLEFQGRHTGRRLAGIDLDFRTTGRKTPQRLQALFDQETVRVEDPFADRSYEATIRMTFHRYREGRPEHDYEVEVREVDEVPEFEFLEIEGTQFPIEEYFETDESNNSIGMHALLRLSNEQFTQLRDLDNPEGMQVRRVGVDDQPFVMRPGQFIWSRHEEEGEEYYKQVVRFFSPDLPSFPNFGLRRLSRMISEQMGRFEALLDMLVQNDTLTQEQKETLLAEEWTTLVGEDRARVIRWKLIETEDVAEDFD